MQPSDIDLHAEWDGFRAGEAEAPVLALLHGFTGSGAGWAPVREGLRAIGPTLAVDLAGHGALPVPVPEKGAMAPYTMPACLGQLERLLERHALPGAWWVGYSMGGRVALQMAVHKPALVKGLVLVSATPGISDPAARAERAAADEKLAAAILEEGMEAFVERWLGNPLFAGLKSLPAEEYARQRAQRLNCDPAGLANSLRGLGTGSMESVWQRLGGIEVPVLLLAGEQDAKFAALAEQMAALLPKATLRLIPGSGHVPQVEKPAAFLEAVRGFFTQIRGNARAKTPN